MLLSRIAATNSQRPASMAPRIRYSLLKNPAPGGMPTIANAATVKAPVVQGMRTASCPSDAMSRAPVR